MFLKWPKMSLNNLATCCQKNFKNCPIWSHCIISFFIEGCKKCVSSPWQHLNYERENLWKENWFLFLTFALLLFQYFRLLYPKKQLQYALFPGLKIPFWKNLNFGGNVEFGAIVFNVLCIRLYSKMGRLKPVLYFF